MRRRLMPGLVTSRWRALADPADCGQCFGGGDVDVGDPDECAGTNEFFYCGFANAAGAAGDKRVSAVEAKGLRRRKIGQARIELGRSWMGFFDVCD